MPVDSISFKPLKQSSVPKFAEPEFEKYVEPRSPEPEPVLELEPKSLESSKPMTDEEERALQEAKLYFKSQLIPLCESVLKHNPDVDELRFWVGGQAKISEGYLGRGKGTMTKPGDIVNVVKIGRNITIEPKRATSMKLMRGRQKARLLQAYKGIEKDTLVYVSTIEGTGSSADVRIKQDSSKTYKVPRSMLMPRQTVPAYRALEPVDFVQSYHYDVSETLLKEVMDAFKRNISTKNPKVFYNGWSRHTDRTIAEIIKEGHYLDWLNKNIYDPSCMY